MNTDLKPGRELDALVAEKVMGWEAPHPEDFGDIGRSIIESRGDDPYAPARYSTDIAAAWTILEKLPQFAYGCAVSFRWMDRPEATGQEWEVNLGPGHPRAIGISVPHAICLAALKSVGER